VIEDDSSRALPSAVHNAKSFWLLFTFLGRFITVLSELTTAKESESQFKDVILAVFGDASYCADIGPFFYLGLPHFDVQDGATIP
jgi:hypothetical protein